MQLIRTPPKALARPTGSNKAFALLAGVPGILAQRTDFGKASDLQIVVQSPHKPIVATPLLVSASPPTNESPHQQPIDAAKVTDPKASDNNEEIKFPPHWVESAIKRFTVSNVTLLKLDFKSATKPVSRLAAQIAKDSAREALQATKDDVSKLPRVEKLAENEAKKAICVAAFDHVTEVAKKAMIAAIKEHVIRNAPENASDISEFIDTYRRLETSAAGTQNMAQLLPKVVKKSIQDAAKSFNDLAVQNALKAAGKQAANTTVEDCRRLVGCPEIPILLKLGQHLRGRLYFWLMSNETKDKQKRTDPKTILDPLPDGVRRISGINEVRWEFAHSLNDFADSRREAPELLKKAADKLRVPFNSRLAVLRRWARKAITFVAKCLPSFYYLDAIQVKAWLHDFVLKPAVERWIRTMENPRTSGTFHSG